MGQLAPRGFIKVLQHLGGSLSPCYGFASRSDWKRPIFLLIVSVMLSLWLAAGNVDANVLFQSPQSPAVEPAVAQPPPVPVEQAPVEQAPVEQAPVEQAPVEQAPVEQAPVEQAPVEQAPVEQAPVEQAPVEQQPAPEAVPATDQPNALTAPEPDTPRNEEPSIDTESAASSNFILDQAEFIDTVVVSGAYIWLCCGVSLFLLVPLFLLFVYIRGRSKILQEENF